MRHLKRGFLLLLLLIALVATLAFSTAGSAAADALRMAALQAADVDLLISINPINVEPGQQATVTVTLKNFSPGPIAPEVMIYLPSSASVRFQELPAGTIFNAQSGTLSWQPVMPGNGSELQLSLPIVANVADPHAPEQTIRAAVRAGEAEISEETRFWIGLAPVASIRLNPPQVAVGQPIQLVGDVTGPGPVAQLWSLGDGRIVEAQDPSVVYPAAGAYEIVFQASTPMGVISQSAIVNVIAQAIARFGVSDYTPEVGAQVSFINESGGQEPLSYLWDFGDGSISTEKGPAHVYQLPGTYDVRLFVTGANGQSEAIQTLTVGGGPVADFVIGDVVDAGAVVQGQAFVDDSVTAVTWDMGDGRIYEGPVIEHVYWSAGDYPVTVTASNEFGELRMLRSVRVNPGPLFLYLPLIQGALSDQLAAPDATAAIVQEQQPAEVAGVAQEELPLLDLPADLSQHDRLFAYINEARRVNGLAALNLVPELSAAAQAHADDMATYKFSSHTGSDGSVPALRVLLSGYPGGYAGEATAWGMAEANEPVSYWLTSPNHRAIILNPQAKDVGVGFSRNFDAPGVWYWTAEFASLDLPVVEVPLPPSMTPPPEPVLTLLGPPADGQFAMTAETRLIFTWSWPLPLAAEERFAVYLNSQGRTTQIGTVRAPESGDQYQFTTSAGNVPARPGQLTWFVRLEHTSTGEMSEQSEAWPIVFVSQP